MEAATSQVGPFGFQFHQVALYTNDVDNAVKGYQELGFHDWTYDGAILRGCRFFNSEWQDVESVAVMAFNYQIMPMELEFLSYANGEHRHVDRAAMSSIPFISHMSTHVEDVIATMAKMWENWRLKPYHLFVTDGHTNSNIVGKKRFLECIYDTRATFGYDIKCIQRLPWHATLTARELVKVLEGITR